MGRLFEYFLEGARVYTCAECGIDLTTSNELVSTSFRGRTGTAWLFSKVYNVSEGRFEERMMTTGQHSIVDIYCNCCGSNLGWKYLEASQESQKYKRGKFILEKKLFKGHSSEDDRTSSDD